MKVYNVIREKYSSYTTMSNGVDGLGGSPCYYQNSSLDSSVVMKSFKAKELAEDFVNIINLKNDEYKNIVGRYGKEKKEQELILDLKKLDPQWSQFSNVYYKIKEIEVEE